MGRLDPDILARSEALCDRCLDVADALTKQNGHRRVIDQLVGSGTSVGANVFEADEAMSRADFTKCLCIAIKELSETRFWIRLIGRRGSLSPDRFDPLDSDLVSMKRVLGTMVARTRHPKPVLHSDPSSAHPSSEV
ncbi:MAG: four helix bundle protein [Phycisphaeraceae bacterium]|nr:MAG: four helix bundle protein [Phycisphaeraceae bacterium]